MSGPRSVGFVAFFIMWAKLQGWQVPLLHIRICHWLETCDDPTRVLMVFRGAAKSTLYAVYKAWKLYRDRNRRSLVWSADNETAGMLTADTINVLRNHPLCGGMLPRKPGAKRFWVNGAKDARNASMRAVGVNTNATGARADDIDFDDIEVPGNIETPQARAKLRQRISESIHIAVPGAQLTYIGTPHTHDSIYPEQIRQGATVLKVQLFEHSLRIDAARAARETMFQLPFVPGEDGLYVMLGIGEHSRVLNEGLDFKVIGGVVKFPKPPGAVMDICSGCAWPERFTRKEIEGRRRKTKTLNSWDSNYMLEAKPLEDIRLDPDRITPYAVHPVMTSANREPMLMLGSMRMVGCSARWDCALGKIGADASAFCVVYTDSRGHLYWHVAEGLTGTLDQQCKQIRSLVLKFHIPAVTVELNGPGGFVPATLRKHLAGIGCGVVEHFASTNKNKDILDAFEAPLSNGFLWAHESVLDGPVWDQMKDWRPDITDQPDDYIDAAGRAIKATPVRIGHIAGNPASSAGSIPWRPDSGSHEVTLEA